MPLGPGIGRTNTRCLPHRAFFWPGPPSLPSSSTVQSHLSPPNDSSRAQPIPLAGASPSDALSDASSSQSVPESHLRIPQGAAVIRLRSRNLSNLATLNQHIPCAFLQTRPQPIGGRRSIHNDSAQERTFIARLGKVGVPSTCHPRCHSRARSRLTYPTISNLREQACPTIASRMDPKR